MAGEKFIMMKMAQNVAWQIHAQPLVVPARVQVVRTVQLPQQLLVPHVKTVKRPMALVRPAVTQPALTLRMYLRGWSQHGHRTMFQIHVRLHLALRVPRAPVLHRAVRRLRTMHVHILQPAQLGTRTQPATVHRVLVKPAYTPLP